MKTTFTLFLFWLYFFPCLAQWEELSPGVTVNYFSDVFAISQNKAIVVGTNGTILKTTDAGETWEQKDSGTTEILNHVQFASDQIGYISGGNGVFLKTIDGGETWNSIDEICASNLSVVDENLIFVVCNGSVHKSEDGAETWIAMNNIPNSSHMQFLNGDKGFAGNYLWDGNWENPQFHTTNDGGISWSSITGVAPFHFLDENIGFYYLGGLHKTIDSGNSFGQLTYAPNEEYALSDINAVNGNTIWGIIYLELLDWDTSSRGFIKISSTDSETYEEVLLWDQNPELNFNAIHFANETMGYAVGSRGDWLNQYGIIWRNGNGINEPMSIDEQSMSNFQVYPNPASSELNIIMTHTKSEPIIVEILDLSGKKVYSQNFSNNNKITIDVKGIEKGIYILKVNNQTQKVMIK